MSPLLEVADLKVHFPTATGPARAVDGISFRLEADQVLGLVGESGCGKSVTGLALLRLHPPTVRVSGSVRYKDFSILDIPERHVRCFRGRDIAMVFQEPGAALNPLFSLGSQLAEAVRCHQRLGRRGAWAAAIELLQVVQFPRPERAARQYPHELSGGMQQRGAIALALAGRPNFLIADEPTSSLDATVQAEILALLRRLRAERRLALLLITHDWDVVAGMADRVAVMYAGKIVEQGPVKQLMERPRHPYTAALLACRPRLAASRSFRTIEGTVPAATAWPAGCRFQSRCPYRAAECAAEPPVSEVSPDHVSACWRRDEFEERGVHA